MKLDFLPVKMRLPLKFGAEVIDTIQIAPVKLRAYGQTGIVEEETPERRCPPRHAQRRRVRILTSL